MTAELHIRDWRAFLKELPSREEVINLLVSLEEICKFHEDEKRPLSVDYGIIRRLTTERRIGSIALTEIISPAVFLRLPKDESGRVLVTTLLKLISQCITEKCLFGSLASFSVGDPVSEHIMSIDSLEDWLFQQGQRLFQIQKMTEQFLPLWVFTAAHTITFFHGQLKPSKLNTPNPHSSRVGTTSMRIRIRDFVVSSTIHHLQQMGKHYLEDMEANPFSRLRAVRYYDSFPVFDTNRSPDSNSFDQCCIFGGGYMNPVFMDRLLSSSGGPSMDYRRFLSFAIAWDNRKTVEAVRFFWPVVDKEQKGFVSLTDLDELIRGVLMLLQCLPTACGPQGPRAVTTLTDEIKDIFRTYSIGLERTGDCLLTMKEAIECPEAFGIFLGLVGNTQTFIEYECREDTAHKHFVARQMKEMRTARAKASESTRAGQLAILQQLVDECWFYQDPATISSPLTKFGSFAEFLDYHEATYGGESMEPWLARYYEWEQQEAERAQMQLLSDTSQYQLSEGDSVTVIQRADEEISVADPSELVEARE